MSTPSPDLIAELERFADLLHLERLRELEARALRDAETKKAREREPDCERLGY